MLDRALDLPVVEGGSLPRGIRDALRPGETVRDRNGVPRRLPRWFYEVASGENHREIEIAPCFELREFMLTDVREDPALRGERRYIPCAVTLLAASLAVLRQRWGTYVYIAANGGYRSPQHALTRFASAHCWGTAANIYRVGDTFLDNQEAIEHYAADARAALPGIYVRAYGTEEGYADDHLHLDLGYVEVVPHEAEAEVE